MALPNAKIKINKDGVHFEESIDRANYTIQELTRAALRDVGKFVCKETRKKIRRRTGKVAKNTQYWVRKQETDLLVGFKTAGWYGAYQELGTEKQPKIGALYNTVAENIDTIRKIEGEYLSAIEDENRALGLIDEEETLGDEE